MSLLFWFKRKSGLVSIRCTPTFAGVAVLIGWCKPGSTWSKKRRTSGRVLTLILWCTGEAMRQLALLELFHVHEKQGGLGPAHTERR